MKFVHFLEKLNLHGYHNELWLTSQHIKDIVVLPYGAWLVDQAQKRESGENPELPRSGEQERTLLIYRHWFGHELGSWSY